MKTITAAMASPEVPMNENFESLKHIEVYARRQDATTGLVWGYWGGRWGGSAVADGTVTLAASSTNYVVAHRTTGVVSTSTSSTNWANTATYGRMYLVVTGTSTVTSYEDHRAGPNGVHSYVPPVVGLATQNVYTKNQSVSPFALTSGATVAVDATQSSNFKLVLAHNATLANPTGLTDGMILNFRIKQDATGGRTLAYGSKFKFPGGTAPVLSTAANAVDFMSCYYDSTDDSLVATLNTGFA